MEKLKVYLDTSVISHLMQEDVPEKMADTLKLWDMFKEGKYDVYLSTVTLEEVSDCPEPKRSKMYDYLEQIDYTPIEITDDMSNIAQQIIDMGILIGTDFSEGLKGVGAKTALKLAKKGELENKLAKLQEESSHDISEVREIFLNHNVNTDYKIRWKKPAKNDIIDFLCEEHGFSQDRVSKACDKLKNLNSSQKSLEDWF